MINLAQLKWNLIKCYGWDNSVILINKNTLITICLQNNTQNQRNVAMSFLIYKYLFFYFYNTSSSILFPTNRLNDCSWSFLGFCFWSSSFLNFVNSPPWIHGWTRKPPYSSRYFPISRGMRLFLFRCRICLFYGVRHPT